jgi:hypothetical protein
LPKKAARREDERGMSKGGKLIVVRRRCSRTMVVQIQDDAKEIMEIYKTKGITRALDAN